MALLPVSSTCTTTTTTNMQEKVCSMLRDGKRGGIDTVGKGATATASASIVEL